VIIRCERCSTMYELDETLLAPDGSQVQCTKCQHVFTAVPPGAPGRTLVGVPAQAPTTPPSPPAPAAEQRPEPRSATQPERAATPPRPAASGPSRSPATAAANRPDGAPPRVARTGTPSVYRPPAGSPPMVARPPVLKRDTVGTFEARLRWAARWRWLAPALGVVLAAAVAGGWLFLRGDGGGDAGTGRAHAEARALLALDDAASLEEATERLAALERGAPGRGEAAADRALALVLRAASLVDDRDAATARLSAGTDERERLRREAPAGWEDAERAAAAEVAALEPQVRALEEKARTLAASAAERLRGLQREVGDTPEVVRATAALHALQGEREPLQKLVRTARERGGRDAWLDLAEGWMDARDPERGIRERAVVRLGAVSTSRPELLRARYLIARAEASLGRRAEALATLDGVLSANPRHGGARRLHAELSAPPPVAAPAALAPPSPPPPAAKAPTPVRKPVPQPAPAASAPAPVPVPPAAPAGDGPQAAPAPPAPATPPTPASPPAEPSPAHVAPQPAPVEASPSPPAPAPPRPPRAPRPVPDAEPPSGG
jgi:predicted Zn finger-like uncharacterized protein